MNYPNLTAISCTPIFNGHYLQKDINTDPVYLTIPYLNVNIFTKILKIIWAIAVYSSLLARKY